MNGAKSFKNIKDGLYGQTLIMKAFLIKVLFFTTLLLIGAFAVDFTLEKGLRKSRAGDFSDWNDIFDSNINSDVIVLGNSRAPCGFSPQILDSVLCVNSYNLGMVAHPFSMQYVRFKVFEKYNKKPRVIIQNIDFFTLAQGHPMHKEQFLPYLHEDLLKNELKKMGVS
ncbi:hypothetical protein AGMMS49525_13470 [Bacteroidia bacterium]|nr:hypothetical protein AGMMS49525_13470 [Bacteroidia bacterium]